MTRERWPDRLGITFRFQKEGGHQKWPPSFFCFIGTLNTLEREEDTKMANKTLFAGLRGALIPQTDAVNAENAPAYALAPKQALAQYAATGCFGRTFYATAKEQLTRVLELCRAVEPDFVARVKVGL